MKEIEVKVLDIDKAAVIGKLEKMGCQLVKDEAQVNTIYDFPDLRLLKKKGYARIREVRDHLNNQNITFMTVKTMVSQEKYKIMDESETIIDDPLAGHGIFKSFGMFVRKVLIKDRISYQYKNSLIEIDDVKGTEYPFPLLEVETIYDEELQEILDLLGYTLTDTTSLTMTEIMANYFKENEDQTLGTDDNQEKNSSTSYSVLEIPPHPNKES